MSQFRPFAGTHFDPKSLSLADVITPPYDVITPEMADNYRSRSPYNFAHVDLPTTDDAGYRHSNELLKKWKAAHATVKSSTPSFYLYQQAYPWGGTTHRRSTLFGMGALAEYAEKAILPHENTFGKYKEDRLRLTKETQTNLSPIFGMVRDPEAVLSTMYEKIAFAAPLFETKTDDGVQHALWQVPAIFNNDITQFFSSRSIYLVDGHHRYESALQLARETGSLGQLDKPEAWTMFAIANASDPSLLVLPTHRYISGLSVENLTSQTLEASFDLHRVSVSEMKKYLSKPVVSPSLGLYFLGDLYVVAPKRGQAEEAEWGPALTAVSVTWSDRKLMPVIGVTEENRRELVTYGKDIDPLWEKRAQAQAIIFHAPPKVEHVLNVADEGKCMPQKSTFFFPKLASGVLWREF